MRAQRWFLKLVAGFVVLLIAVALVWRLAGERLIMKAVTPTRPFDATAAPPAPDHGRVESWVARPDQPADTDPARWTPEGYRPAARPVVETFFLAPTAIFDRRQWNAAGDDRAVNARLDWLVRMNASVFNGMSRIWAPRYRQATLGAFLKPGPDTDAALALAYGDVERAFDAFLAAVPADAPILLAGHSQGARHLLHLLANLNETGRLEALRDRLIGVYAVGWPVVAGDLGRMGIDACKARAESGCLLSWQSFAEDSDAEKRRQTFRGHDDLSGRPVTGQKMVCTNPLTGGPGEAPTGANIGMLEEPATRPVLVPGQPGARCDGEGFLLIAPTPKKVGAYVFPNGNFHVYDYALFWANTRADAEARLAHYSARRFGTAEASE